MLFRPAVVNEYENIWLMLDSETPPPSSRIRIERKAGRRFLAEMAAAEVDVVEVLESAWWECGGGGGDMVM